MTRGTLVVLSGGAGAAPAPGQSKLFNIDFGRFVSLPAPVNPVQFRVRVRVRRPSRRGGPRQDLPARLTERSPTRRHPTPCTSRTRSSPTRRSRMRVCQVRRPTSTATRSGTGRRTRWPASSGPTSSSTPTRAIGARTSRYLIYQAQCTVNSNGFCMQAHIKYYYLFVKDGGWQSCSPWCDDAHNGDNQPFDIDVYRHIPEKNNPYSYWYSDWGGERFEFHPPGPLPRGREAPPVLLHELEPRHLRRWIVLRRRRRRRETASSPT